MPEHVYLTPVPDSMSEPTAFNSRNIPSQVVVSRTTLCTLLSPPSFASLFSQKFQRNHSLSASARSTEHLCWLPAKNNTYATATRLGCSPKFIVRNTCAGYKYNARSERKISDIFKLLSSNF